MHSVSSAVLIMRPFFNCSVPVLYEEMYGPLPLTTASGKTCVKDVVKSVLSLQGSKLTETIVILQSQPGKARCVCVCVWV